MTTGLVADVVVSQLTAVAVGVVELNVVIGVMTERSMEPQVSLAADAHRTHGLILMIIQLTDVTVAMVVTEEVDSVVLVTEDVTVNPVTI